MIRIGILGGTFDPVHIGHIEIAKSAMRQCSLAQVRVMTAGIPPHKRDKKTTPSRMRYKMTELAISGEAGLFADDYELKKSEYSYTANTLCELKKLHPEWDIYFIIGEDSLRDLHLWYKPEVIVRNCTLLVYPRKAGSNINDLKAMYEEKMGAEIIIIDAPEIDVSSTEIREKIKNGESADGLLPEKVMEYIRETGLYRT